MHYRDVRKRREKGIENVLGEIMAENCPNLKKETDIQVQEAQRVQTKMNPNRPTPRRIVGVESGSPASQVDSLPSAPPGKPYWKYMRIQDTGLDFILIIYELKSNQFSLV